MASKTDASNRQIDDSANEVKIAPAPRGHSDNETRADNETRLTKRSVAIAGHYTSISLEQIFWAQLKAIAANRSQSVASLVASIDASRSSANLSSAIRVFILKNALDRQNQVK